MLWSKDKRSASVFSLFFIYSLNSLAIKNLMCHNPKIEKNLFTLNISLNRNKNQFT